MAETIAMVSDEHKCVYIATERGNKFFDARLNVAKIGIACKSKKDDIIYQRNRALNQGNPAGLKFEQLSPFYEKSITKRLEDRISEKLKQKGFQNLHQETTQTGHGEWWIGSIVDIEKIAKEVINEDPFLKMFNGSWELG